MCFAVMAESHLPEIFPNMTLLIDPETSVESRTVLKRPGVRQKERGSHIEVSGSFKEIDDVFMELPRKERNKGDYDAPKERNSEYEHTSACMRSASSARVEPVEVDSVIMSYIKENCSAELSKISRPEISMQVNKQQVTFDPRETEHGTVLAQLARERFITFYQKIATGLQSRSYPFDATQLQPLLAKFPDLLIRTGQRKTGEITLIGKLVSFERFEQFLLSSPKRSSPSQIDYNMDMGTAASSQASQKKIIDKEETCSICLEQMMKSQMKTLEKCKHSFCRDCLKRAFEIKPVCPTCGVLYGALKGTQPKGGKMKVTYDKLPLPGYENYGTIIIHYIIPDGVQENEHPNPGQPYQGATRQAYLPDSTEGKKVYKLLKQAFDQRLIFTIGRSSTTGRSNVVTWNDIHHKTSRIGGPTAYGYPDPNYLKRVQEELKVKGIYC